MGENVERTNLRNGFLVGEWLVEPSRNRLSREDKELTLEPKVMDVLLCLASEPGQTVTKEEFFEQVWTGMVVTDDVLSRCISELRKSLEDDPRDPRYIETIRKTGYRLITPVRSRPDRESDYRVTKANPTPDPRIDERVEARPPHSPPRHPPRQSKRRLITALSIVAALLIVLAVTLINRQSGTSDAPVTLPYTSMLGLELDPFLSPDGRRVAFVANNNERSGFDLYVKQEGSDRPLRLSQTPEDERYPVWSPDGLFLAFSRTDNVASRIISVPSLGGQERSLLELPGDVKGLSWSPDGEQLVVSAQVDPYGPRQLLHYEFASGAVKALTKPADDSYGDIYPSISPDGSSLAFVRNLTDEIGNIFTIDQDGQNLRQVTSDSVSISGIDWHPDGRSIFYAAQTTQNDGLWLVELASGKTTGVASALPGTHFEYPTLSEDGRRLTYIQRTENVNIWRLFKPPGFPSLRSRPLVISTHWDGYPDISSDGQRVTFASLQTGFREIWTVERDGENPSVVTTQEGSASVPRWSPDGTQIAYEWRRGGQTDVYVTDVEGGAPTRLTASPSEDVRPFWSHDGSSVLFISNRTGRWQVWQSTDGGPTPVTQTGVRYAMTAPDGSSLFVTRTDTTGIWAIPTDAADSTRDARLIFSNLDERDWANWAVTPSGVYFVDRTSYTPALSFYGFQSRKTTRLQNLDDIPAEPALGVAGDFSWFVFTQIDDQASDVMMIDGMQ